MIRIRIEGLEKQLQRLAGAARQARFAAVKAINVTAKKVVDAERAEIARVFDRPRPSTRRAVVIKQYASKARVEAIVAVDDYVRKTAGESQFDANVLRQGKDAVPPTKFLAAQMMGGKRVPKRFERALQRIKAMPEGTMAVFARRSNALDQYGNLSGAKIVQILSWFQAFPESGYRANMKRKSKDRLMKGKRKGLKWGFAYFRGGPGTGLPDGVWERHYPSGLAGRSFVRPVLIYVRTTSYSVRFRFDEVGSRVVRVELGPQFQAALTQALRTAK